MKCCALCTFKNVIKVTSQQHLPETGKFYPEDGESTFF
jgi:hypothetical protein